MEDTGLLVIISFSWVASHLPRPTTKQELFISHFMIRRTYRTFIFPESVSALLVQHGRKNVISQSQSKTCQKPSCLGTFYGNSNTKIGQQLRTW